MSHELHDLVGHHVWANAQLLGICRGLDEPTLDTTVPGTYGTILQTLRHLIDAEMPYLDQVTGAWSTPPSREDDAVGLEVLAERAAVLAAVLASTLEMFLAGEWDRERRGEARLYEDKVFAVPT